MKTEYIVLALAGAAVFLIVKAQSKPAAARQKPRNATDLIFESRIPDWMILPSGKPIGGTADDPAYG